MATHGQGHQRSRLQPQHRKLKTAITKCSSWLNHNQLIAAGQGRHRAGRQLPVFPISRAESERSLVALPFQPHIPAHPFPQHAAPGARAHAGRPSKRLWWSSPGTAAAAALCSLQLQPGKETDLWNLNKYIPLLITTFHLGSLLHGRFPQRLFIWRRWVCTSQCPPEEQAQLIFFNM